MAEIAHSIQPPVPMALSKKQLVSTIAYLRWRLLANSLRTVRGRLEAVSRVMIACSMTAASLGGGVLLAVVAHKAAVKSNALYLDLVLWLIFGFWQLYPLFGSLFSPPFESNELLRFPLSFPSFYLLSFSYELLNPVTWVCGMWVLGIFVGAAVGRPLLALPVGLVLLSFLLFNILLARVIFTWLERWLAQRKTRELLSIVFFLFVISLQFLGPLMQHFGGRHRAPSSELLVLMQVQKFFPAGMAANSLGNMFNGNYGGAAIALAGIAAYIVIFAVLLRVRLHGQFSGENFSEGVASQRVKGKSKVGAGWKIPGLSNSISAIVEKEFHYLLRSGPIVFTLVMPLIILVMFRFLPGANGHSGNPLRRAMDFVFPIGVAYSTLILTNIVYNTFGADGAGFQMYLAAPVRMREVLLGKNLAHSFVLLIETFGVFVLTSLLFRPPSPTVFFLTLAGLMFALPLNLSGGNVMSVFSPKRYDLSTFGRQRATGATAFVSMGIHVLVLGCCSAIVFFARAAGYLWMAIPIFLLLAGIAWAVYAFILGKMAHTILNRREVMLAELCRV
jgi:ABC-2 type transport system permease protein